MIFSKVRIELVKEKDFKYNSRKVKSTTDTVNYIKEIENLDLLAEENVYIICLDTKNHIVAYSLIAKGGVNFSNIDMKTIFKTTLLSNASKFILVHNHPSGDTKPSTQDILVTKKIESASKILDIEFLDHIIIADNEWASIRKEL